MVTEKFARYLRLNKAISALDEVIAKELPSKNSPITLAQQQSLVHTRNILDILVEHNQPKDSDEGR